MTDKDLLWDRLHLYWNDIPLIGKISTLKLNEVMNQPIRKFIMDHLRFGEDTDVERVKRLKRRRHAFSAKELHTAYNNKFKDQKKVSVQNFHFHIKKLLENELIKVVVEIIEGNVKTKYYGRIVNLYLLDDYHKIKVHERTTYLEPLIQIFKSKNKNFDEETINRLFEESFERKTNLIFEKLLIWIKENNELIYNLKLDTYALINYLHSMLMYKDSDYLDYIMDQLEISLD